jgi:hypothetical protein
MRIIAIIASFTLLLTSEIIAQNFVSMGKHNDKGVPLYLENTKEEISPTLLADLNVVLPDGENLSIKNPQLYKKNMGYVTLEQSGDVYLAFISEGADFRSSIGFYTYKTQPPANPYAINNAKMVFPNASADGSGGGLIQGNRVKLGNFAAGTSIGFFLISNGFQNGRVQPIGNPVFFTDPKLNPEFENNLKKHAVFLWDELSGRFLLMFEDMDRARGSDHDFNDAVFMISTGASNQLATDGSPEIHREKQIKTGIPDVPARTLTICHYPPGSQDNPQAITILENDWPAHQSHGDVLGNCPNVTKPQPPVVIAKDFNATGDWRLSGRNQINTILLTQTGITVKSSNSPRWFAYTRTGINTYYDGTGNMYWFEDNDRGGWKSAADNTVISIYRVTDNFHGINENDVMGAPAAQNRFIICHYPPGNSNNPQEITIPQSAWASHEAHGDVMGPCIVQPQSDQPSQPDLQQPEEVNWITICHRPPGNPENVQVLTINENAWPAHAAHGDTQGPCPIIPLEQEPPKESTPEKKIVICHYPPGNQKNPQQLTIPESAWPAHQKHGDKLGPCR